MKKIENDKTDENEVDGDIPINDEELKIDEEKQVITKLSQRSETVNTEEEENIKPKIILNQKVEASIKQEDEEVIRRELIQLHKNLIEGALYASGSPLDIEELSVKLEISKKEVEKLVNQLAVEYLERAGALIIAQVGDRFQMQLRPEYTEQVSKFAKGGGISEANLRTLTIIALKQPILKSTLVKIRGTGAYEHVKYLLDNELISAVKKGRTHELTTTDKYADMFGLPKNKQELKKMMVSQLGLNEQKEDQGNLEK